VGRFDRQIAQAERMIARDGEAVKWRVNGDVSPTDPAKPWKPGTASPGTDKDVTICFLPVGRYLYETVSFMRESEVPKGCVVGLMAPVDFEPNVKDVVIRSGVQFRIETIDVLNPNGQVILYTLVLRQ